MAKRIILFIITNILVIATLSILASVLGVGNYLTASGIDYKALLIFCLFWGMTGSLISLAMSRIMAKWMMGVKLVDGRSGQQAAWLVSTVERLARRANLPAVPEVGIYESPEVNAFATGPTKSRSLVAVSSGLLSTMNQEQIEGVLGHEIAHIQNGDMVTLTLLQGVINAFVMFFARVIAFAVSQNAKEENRALINMVVVIVLQIGLSILGALVVSWFSRQREFRADEGSSKITSKASMRNALEGLKRLYTPAVDEEAKLHPSMAAMKISGARGGWMALFSTHPPLEERIKRLQ